MGCTQSSTTVAATSSTSRNMDFRSAAGGATSSSSIGCGKREDTNRTDVMLFDSDESGPRSPKSVSPRKMVESITVVVNNNNNNNQNHQHPYPHEIQTRNPNQIKQEDNMNQPSDVAPGDEDDDVDKEKSQEVVDAEPPLATTSSSSVEEPGYLEPLKALTITTTNAITITRPRAILPGYSSGASSLDLSEHAFLLEEEGEDEDRAGDYGSSSSQRRIMCPAAQQDHTPNRPRAQSKHSQILDLSNLRQEMVAAGDLTKTVVRIEPCYGQNIEDVYDGVTDGKTLGSGVSGTVRLVTHKKTKVQYAVKILEFDKMISTNSKKKNNNTTGALRQLRDEIFIMCQLDHPNIVRIEEVYESPNEIYIVQELCLGGDLFDRLDKEPDWHQTEAQCAKLVKQMLSAVRYLHSKGIIHRDLKLESFLFSSEDPDSELRMIDFGLSKHFVPGEHLQEQVGTPYTVAPEIIQGNYDEKCDMWALGVITYLLLSGETPFGGLEGEDPRWIKQNIERARPLFEPADVWQSVSADAMAFVKRLLQANPNVRPTAKQAQKDNWIQIWAKKDAKLGNRINPKTINALMAFKEQSDMQKLLSEVLSFTLLPEQIVELRAAFQKMDAEGTGEISLQAMKMVLLQNAEAGSLGGLTETEIESLFDSIRVRKSYDDPTIHWHEFLAAGLSQAKIDDRNLRLAFDRMDTQRKGFITLQDLKDVLGKCAGDADKLELVWLDCLNQVQASDNDCINYENFKMIMKGQSSCSNNVNRLGASQEFCYVVPEGALTQSMSNLSRRNSQSKYGMMNNNKRNHAKIKSKSFHAGDGRFNGMLSPSSWDSTDSKTSASRNESSLLWEEQRQGGSLYFELSDPSARDDLESMSPLVANRALYRHHREMRMAVLEASKQFDYKHHQRQRQQQQQQLKQQQEKQDADADHHNADGTTAATVSSAHQHPPQPKTRMPPAGLVMKRGSASAIPMATAVKEKENNGKDASTTPTTRPPKDQATRGIHAATTTSSKTNNKRCSSESLAQ
ncbi:hypothetical protein ACA910_007588 [Epithemia clementina (nom. ined.)]